MFVKVVLSHSHIDQSLLVVGYGFLKATAHIFRLILHTVMLTLNTVTFHHYDVEKIQ